MIFRKVKHNFHRIIFEKHGHVYYIITKNSIYSMTTFSLKVLSSVFMAVLLLSMIYKIFIELDQLKLFDHEQLE
jgi:hypothetical protein